MNDNETGISNDFINNEEDNKNKKTKKGGLV